MEKTKKIKLFVGLSYLLIVCLFLYFFFSKFSLQEISSYELLRNNTSYFIELKNSNLLLISIICAKLFNVIPDISIPTDIIIFFVLLFASITVIYAVYIYINRFSSKRLIISSFCFLNAQIILSTFLYALGLIGNPNNALKSFISNSPHSYIFNSNIVYLTKLNGKYKTLFQYYIPNYEYISSDEIRYYKGNYVFVDDKYLKQLKEGKDYTLISNYEKFKLIKILN